MKFISKLTKISPFLLGIFLGFLIINFTHCPDKATGPTTENPVGIETPELKSFAKVAENTFASGNRDSVLAITSEEFAEVVSDYLPTDPAELKKFGEALSKKKLIYAAPMYAEYEINIDNKKFTIAFGQSGDGNWKLIRY